MEKTDKEQNYNWVWIVVIIIIFYIFIINANDSSSNTDSYSNPKSDYSSSDSYENDENEEEPSTFNGYKCTDDCSGHEAGYEWAEENDITQDDVDGYSGNSDSFEEGMQSYVDENY